MGKGNVKAQRRRRKRRRIDFVGDIRKNGVCSSCGRKDVFLEFHHSDPSVKESTIAHLVHHSRSMERLREEVAKCVLVCRDCHVRIHRNAI